MRDVINLDYSLLIPEYLLGLVAIAIIVVDLFLPKTNKKVLPVIALLGLAAAFGVSLAYIDTTENFAGLFFIDDYTTFFRCFCPILLIYYPFFAFGLDQAKAGEVPPYTVWAGNLVLALIGVWLLRKVIRN